MGAGGGGVHWGEKPEEQPLAISTWHLARYVPEGTSKNLSWPNAKCQLPKAKKPLATSTWHLARYVPEGTPKNFSWPNAKCQLPKSPPIVCLGRARVDNRWATVSPYSPCVFRSVSGTNPETGKSCGENVKICNFQVIETATIYSGIAGGLDAISWAKRVSLRKPSKSASL